MEKIEELFLQKYDYFKEKNNRNSISADFQGGDLVIADFIFDLSYFFYVNAEDDEKIYCRHILDDNKIDYLMNQKMSCFIKARFYDYIIQNNKQKNINNVKISIENYIEAFDDSKDFDYKCSCIYRIVFLSKKFKLDYGPNVCSLLNKINTELNDVDVIPVSIIDNLYNYGVISVNDALNLCKNGIKKDISQIENFSSLGIRILKKALSVGIINKNDSQKYESEVYSEEAKAYENLADNDNLPFRKGFYYTKALSAYKNAKVDMLSDMIMGLRKKKDESQKNTFKSMKSITYKRDLSKYITEIKKRISECKEEDLILLLCRFDGLLDKDRQIDAIKENYEKSPLSSLFPNSYLDNEGKTVSYLRPIDSGKDDKENEAILLDHVYDSIRGFSEYAGNLIALIINQLKERTNKLPDYMDEIVDKSYIIKESRKAIVKKGLRAGLNYENDVALSILIPQIECSIRELAALCGDTKYKLEDKNQIESINSLEYFFKDGSPLQQCIDERIFITLYAAFISEHGLNYRNRFAHGMIDSFENYTAIYVWWLCLYLITIYSTVR